MATPPPGHSRHCRIPVLSPTIPRPPPTPPEGLQLRREGESLEIFLVPSIFRCTEEGCRASYFPAVWATRRQSFQRHLEADHGILIRKTLHSCSLCGATLGTRPSTHPCLTGGNLTASLTQERHCCDECPASFSLTGVGSQSCGHSPPRKPCPSARYSGV